MNNRLLIQPPWSMCSMLLTQPVKLTKSSTGQYKTDDTHFIIHSINTHLSTILVKLWGLETEKAGYEF